MKHESARFVWESEIITPGRWLSLLGTSGAGKTMLAREIMHQTQGRFRAWTRVITWTREGDHRMFEDLMREPVVCIDDVGGEYATDYSRAKLYEFLSEREKMWTVITANLSLEQVGNMLDARIASRMIRHGSVVVDVDVPDFNLRERKLLQ